MRHWLLSLVLLLATFTAPDAALASPATVDTSSSTQATANSAQRKTFFDSTNNRHWAFYYNGTAIEYSYSQDGTTWTSAGTLAYNTANFSAVYKTIGGTSYVFVVTEANTYDVVLRRGELSVGSIVFDAELTVLNGTSASDLYTKPTVALSENNHLWISSLKDFGKGTVERFQVYVRRSTTQADGDLSVLNASAPVGRGVQTLRDAIIMPQNGDGMYLISSADGSNIVGYTYDGANWSSANTGGDYSWFGFGNSGINGFAIEIFTIATNGTDVYVGGNFGNVGGINEADYIAKWDGNAWSALGNNGAGNGAMSSPVGTIAIFGSDVYAGGNFANAASIAEADYVAKWDGNAWSALGSNGAGNGALGGFVYSLKFSGSDLYVGGQFTDAAGVAEADYLAKWDGNAWSAVGSNGAGNGAMGGPVTELAISGGSVYAGGGFTNTAGIAEADYLAMWDGNTWSALGSDGAGNGALNNGIAGLAISGSNLYVSGQFINAAGIGEADFVAMWDGNSWSALGSNGAGNGAITGDVYALIISGSNLYIGGWFTNAAGIAEADYVAMWDGNAWSALGSNGAGNGAINSYVNALAISGSELYVGGFFSATGIVGTKTIARWNGTNWNALDQGGVSGAINAIAISGSELYVGGQFTDAGGIAEADNIAMWDGNSWNALDSNGSGIGVINALAISGSDLYVGGQFTNAAGIAEADRIARWDISNSTWNALSTGLSSTVYAIAISGTDVYVGGQFTNAGNANGDRITRWNTINSSWNSLGTGIATGQVQSITTSGANVYVGGTFNTAGGVANTGRIARWNGAAWNAMGTGIATVVGNNVYVIATSGANVYIGGIFPAAGGVAGTASLARWDGGAWNSVSADGNDPLSNGPLLVQPLVSSIAISGDDIYVGGHFANAGGNANANNIARWNATETTWNSLDAELNGTINTLALVGTNIFTGGSGFTINGINQTVYLSYYAPAIATDANSFTEISATSDTDANIYLSYTNDADEVVFRRYDESDALWEAAVTLNATESSSPSITYKNSDGRVTASWIESNSLNYRHAMTPYQTADWKAEATIYNTGTNSSATTVANQETGTLQVAWTNGAANPYNVYADLLAMDSAPTVTISSTAGSATNSSPIPVTFQFNKTVTGFVVGDIAVGNGSAGNFVAVDGDTYTADITPTAEGNVTVNVAAAVAKDLFDNDNSIATQLSISYDTTAPTVVISSTATSPTNTSPIPVTFQFSQTVTGFVVGDITVGNGTPGNFVAVDGDTYTADITPTAQGAVTVDVAASKCDDAAGNDNTAATQFSITYDSVAPTVVISSTATSPTNTSPIPVTFQFSQTVTGFVVGDITVGNGTAGNFVAVDGDTYTADITPTAQGAVTVDVAASRCDDAAGNDNTAATQFSITYDSVAPSVVISSTATSPTNTSPIPVTFQFSQTVTGFVVGDITVGNGTAGNFVAIDGDTYTADITPTAQGAVTVDVAASKCDDAAGNDNTAATQFPITYDSVAPSVVISSTATSPTSTSPIPLTFEFSEAVTGFTIGDLNVDNASKSNFIAVDGNTYTASITPTEQGIVTVDIAGSVAQDVATNSNTAATQFAITYEVQSTDVDTDGDGVTDNQETIDDTNLLDSGSYLAALPTSWCSDWNGYFGMYNVNEYANLSSTNRHIVATLFDNEGEAQSAAGFSVNQSQQRDFLVHGQQGWQENSYGELCSEVTNGESGDVDGRMVYYKPSVSNAEFNSMATGYDFAFALPYQAGLRGNQFVSFNTMQPSLNPNDSENTIANWIQLTNLEETAQQGSLIFYGFDGAVLASEAVTLETRARRDFATHHLGIGIIGIVEWRPQSSSAKFTLLNTRYYYDNSELLESFDGAVQLEGMKGNGEKISTLLDTRNQTAVLEVANTNASPVTADIKIYDSSGTLQNEQLLTLAPHVSLHIIANQYLNDELGSATINGSAIGSIVAVGMHYGKTETGSISHSYGLIAKQALGTTVHGSYNTYLGQSCELLLLNTTASAVNSTVSMKRLDATPVLTDEIIATPAFGSASFDVCAEEEIDQYGVVTVVAGAKNAITPVIIRSGANGDYRFVTPLR